MLIGRTFRRTSDIVGLLILIALAVNLYASRPEKVSDYLQVTQIYVTDHEPDADPVIIYDRTVVQDFVGEWFARVYPVGDTRSVCQGHARHNYSMADEVYDRTLSWYLGKPCKLDQGRYVMRTEWNIDGVGQMQANSNVWVVVEGAQAM